MKTKHPKCLGFLKGNHKNRVPIQITLLHLFFRCVFIIPMEQKLFDVVVETIRRSHQKGVSKFPTQSIAFCTFLFIMGRKTMSFSHNTF